MVLVNSDTLKFTSQQITWINKPITISFLPEQCSKYSNNLEKGVLTAPRATGQVLWKRKAPAAYLVIFTFFNFFYFHFLFHFTTYTKI